jgi:hypothetical protein
MKECLLIRSNQTVAERKYSIITDLINIMLDIMGLFKAWWKEVVLMVNQNTVLMKNGEITSYEA